MNETTTNICEKIFKELLENPISNVLWEYNPSFAADSVRPTLYLKTIAQKLNHNLYPSPDSFCSDLQELFYSVKTENKKKPLYHIAGTILEEKFRKLTENNPFDTSAMTQKEKEIEDLFSSTQFFAEKTPNPLKPSEEAKDVRSGANVLKKDPNTFTSDDLSHFLSLTKNPDLIITVAAHATKLQPECVTLTDDNLTFHFCLMSEETVHTLSCIAVEEAKKIVI